MAENGIVNNLGVSKRSATGITAMVMLMKLSTSDGSHVLVGMIGITLLAIGYMVLAEIKDKRNAAQRQKG